MGSDAAGREPRMSRGVMLIASRIALAGVAPTLVVKTAPARRKVEGRDLIVKRLFSRVETLMSGGCKLWLWYRSELMKMINRKKRRRRRRKGRRRRRKRKRRKKTKMMMIMVNTRLHFPGLFYLFYTQTFSGLHQSTDTLCHSLTCFIAPEVRASL